MVNNIQALRAFAAINVVLFHIIGTASSYSQGTYFINFLEGWGANGVDIFFVISGFVMLHTQMGNRRSALDFIKSRLIRIVPTYWIITLFAISLFLIFPSAIRGMIVTPNWAFSSLFFTSSIFAEKSPIVHVGWTLEWEMLFYVIFAVALLIRSWSMVIISVGAVLLFVSFISGKLIVLEFLLGLFVAYIFHNRRYSDRFGFAVFAFGLSLLFLSLFPYVREQELDRFLIWGIPSFFIVLGAIYSMQVKGFLLTYLGDASYSIYLIQIITIPAFYKLSSKLLVGFNGDVLAIFCLIASVLSGCIFYSFIEKPITIYLRRPRYRLRAWLADRRNLVRSVEIPAPGQRGGL